VLAHCTHFKCAEGWQKFRRGMSKPQPFNCPTCRAEGAFAPRPEPVLLDRARFSEFEAEDFALLDSSRQLRACVERAEQAFNGEVYRAHGAKLRSSDLEEIKFRAKQSSIAGKYREKLREALRNIDDARGMNDKRAQYNNQFRRHRERSQYT